jgi:hypothetical protein
MGWFRSSRSGVAWLAFFALACQLVLSFGHVHLGNFGGGSGTWAAVVYGDNSPAAVPQSPPQKGPTGLPGTNGTTFGHGGGIGRPAKGRSAINGSGFHKF